MVSTPDLWAIVLTLVTIPTIAVLWGAIKNKDKRAAYPLTLFSVGVIGWSLSIALGLGIKNPELTRASVNFRNLFVDMTVFGWFYVAAEYTQRDWLKQPKYLLAIGLVPIFDQLLGWTNHLHHLMYTSQTRVTTEGILITAPGPYFWYIHAVWTYLFLALAGVLLLDELRGASGIYRKQCLTLLGGQAVGWTSSILWLTGVTAPNEYVDTVPIGLSITGLIFLFALFRFDFLEIAPVARETLVEDMRDGVVALDANRRVIDINNQARKLFDVGDDAVGTTAEKALDGYTELLPETIDSDPKSSEITLTEDGEKRFLDITISPVYEEQTGPDILSRNEPEVVANLIVVRDITKQRQRQQELERSKELLSHTQQLADVGGWELDVDSGNIRWTDKLEDMAEISSDFELTRETALEFYPPSDREKVSTGIQQCIDKAESFECLTQAVTEAGDQRWVRTYGTPHVDPETQEVTKVRGAVLDVTEQRERQQALQRQNERLDQFASVVSHDLRNPLGIAETYLDFARETGDPEDFETVESALDRMDDMIDELLTMAQAGTTVEDTEQIALPELVSEAWKTAGTDGATIENTVPNGTTIKGNRSLLRTVFENLFRNTVDHNETPLTVRVGIDQTNLFVEDTGAGIPPDQRDEIFAHGFTTGDDTTGLGLSIVSDIINAHDWEITVTDEASGGARFEITGAEISQQSVTHD